MGYYIPLMDKPKGKAQLIRDMYGAVPLDAQPEHLSDVANDNALICVIENPMFDAALYVYDEAELQAVLREMKEGDERPRTWLIMDRNLAERDVRPPFRT